MNINGENYVDKAEKVMQKHSKKITTSQIRNMLSMASTIYDKARSKKMENLTDEEKSDIQLLRVRLIYDVGRNKTGRYDPVGDFIKDSSLLDNLKSIGNSRKNLILFCKYMEALVAYHKFYGGKE